MKPSHLFLCLSIACGAAVAQAPAGRPNRVVPTITRTIQLFSTLENDWLDAVQRRDRDALKKIVADDFELRSAAAPGVPTPREESLGDALSVAPFHSTIEQMAAHEYGDVVVVSFLWKLVVPKKGALAQKVFVIDTWKRIDGNWQVVTRYTAPVADAAAGVPGAAPNKPAIEKKI
ncbi:MAG TPA: nuclear transport factor 2 family protein [Telluria sp.]|nr:nuclear transport factor 2 family protein [Telluria sp.]